MGWERCLNDAVAPVSRWQVEPLGRCGTYREQGYSGSTFFFDGLAERGAGRGTEMGAEEVMAGWIGVGEDGQRASWGRRAL